MYGITAILKAASDCFARYGYDKTTLDDINILKEVEKVEGCKEKILTYLTKCLEYIRSAVNYHKLTIKSMKNMKPMIDELYDKNMENEICCLSQILEYCMKKGEIADCDTRKIAKSILTVTEAIKNRTAHCVDCNFSSDVSYTEVENEVVFTVSLILEELKIH